METINFMYSSRELQSQTWTSLEKQGLCHLHLACCAWHYGVIVNYTMASTALISRSLSCPRNRMVCVRTVNVTVLGLRCVTRIPSTSSQLSSVWSLWPRARHFCHTDPWGCLHLFQAPFFLPAHFFTCLLFVGVWPSALFALVPSPTRSPPVSPLVWLLKSGTILLQAAGVQ